jgi:hypothetical protein
MFRKLKKFDFLRVYLSPFKPPKVRFYVGERKIGTPYFLPRKWVKNKEKPGYLKAVKKHIGFDFVGLGWKIKFDDYRFEWSPRISFVFFKWQIALILEAPEENHYWECWLYYRDTDRKKSIKDRIVDARNKYDCVWTLHFGDHVEKICYWNIILKEKWM